MEILNNWQELSYPKLGLTIGLLLGLVFVAAVLRTVIASKEPSKALRRPMLSLVVIPVGLAFLGGGVDYVRDGQYHRSSLPAAVEAWGELEEAVLDRYEVQSMTPVADPVYGLGMVKRSALEDDGEGGRLPLVKVQLVDSVHTEYYRIAASPVPGESGEVEVSLVSLNRPGDPYVDEVPPEVLLKRTSTDH